MSKQILEQVLEHILNKEEGKASDLLHQYFVDKGRSIYESLIQADDLAEDDVFETEIDDDQQSDFADDISAKQDEIQSEEMFSEDEEDFADDEFAQDDEQDDEFANAEEHEDEGFKSEEKDELAGMQDAVLDVEDALDELKSLFAEFQGTEEEQEESEDEFGSMKDEDEQEEEQTEESLEESADLIAVAKPTFGDNGQNAKSPVRANSGQAGMSASPVKMGGGAGEAGGKVGEPKDMGFTAGNRPNQKSAPVLRQVKAPAKPAQASGRSPIAGK